MPALQLFVAFFLPETKGLLIEDVHEVFAAHWFWKRMGVVVHDKVHIRPFFIPRPLIPLRCFRRQHLCGGLTSSSASTCPAPS